MVASHILASCSLEIPNHLKLENDRFVCVPFGFEKEWVGIYIFVTTYGIRLPRYYHLLVRRNFKRSILHQGYNILPFQLPQGAPLVHLDHQPGSRDANLP